MTEPPARGRPAPRTPTVLPSPGRGAPGGARSKSKGDGAPPLVADAGLAGNATFVAEAGPAGNGTTPAEPGASDAGPTSEAAASPSTEPRLRVETPYKLFERTRAKGAVYAAHRDDILARWNVGGTGDPSFISNHPGYHPWPRVRVDTKILGGHLPRRAPFNRRTGHRRHVLSVHRVQAEARANGYWPFRLCSEAGLRRDQKMHGQTILRFSITPRGHVVHAWLVKSKLGDAGVKTCLRHAVRKLEFRPAPHHRIDVKLSVKLWPGDARVPLIGPPDKDKPPDNRGQLDVAAVEHATSDVPDAVRACYRSALGRDPDLWGRIELRVDLDKKGRVRRVAENESHFPDRAVVHCAIEALRNCHFHAAKGGALSFVYALRLGDLAPLPSASSGNE